MIPRIAILSVVMLATAAYLAGSPTVVRIPERAMLASLPTAIGGWSGRDVPPLSQAVLDVLGADDYVNRVYSRSDFGAAGLYIGYYRSQRENDTIHSPLNCLPGAGWEPTSRDYDDVRVTTSAGRERTIRVNRVFVQKGLNRQLVLYWYQSHGRIVASEYWSKVFMVYDAIRTNRTDAALVRVSIPVRSDGPEADETAAAHGRTFVGSLFPLLDRYIPS
jgi:EpsI family protein